MLYATIFFVAAVIFFFLNPLDQIRDLIDLSPDELSIKYWLFNWGLFPIFYNVANIAIVGSVIFLLCSVYLGTKLMRRRL